jgi:hypothetical protein
MATTAAVGTNSCSNCSAACKFLQLLFHCLLRRACGGKHPLAQTLEVTPLALPDLRQPVLLREIGLRRRGAEQCTCLGLVVGDRSHGEVSVPQPLRIMFDAQIEAPQPQ